MLVQAQATRVLFALSEAANPNNPVDGATFSGAEIRVVKSTTGAIANATNQAATINGGADGGIIGVGGGTGLYSILLTAAELTLGLAAGAVGLVSLVINKAGAVPRSILAWYVGAPAAAGGGDVTVAAGSIAAIATAVETQLADNFAAIPTAAAIAVAGELDIPSAADTAAAVGALVDADGVTLLHHQALVGAELYGPGTFTTDGSTTEARSLNGSKIRVAAARNPTTGVRVVSTRDGA